MGAADEGIQQASTEKSESDATSKTIFLIYGVHKNDVKDDIRKFIQPTRETDADLKSDWVGDIILVSGLWLVSIIFLFLVGSIILGELTSLTHPDFFCISLITTGLSIILFPIMWLTITIVFSIFTFGSFFKRRHFTMVLTDRRDDSFVSKLLIATVLRGGVFDERTNDPDFDEWLLKSVKLYRRVTYLRIAGVLLATIWGLLEIDQRFNLLHFVYQFYLWPFRIFMLVIFLPLVLYGAYLVLKIRNHYAEGDLVIHRLKASSSRFDPDIPLSETIDDFSFDSHAE